MNLDPKHLVGVLLLSVVALSGPAHAADTTVKPTVVLVHGAFAESSSWNGVIEILMDQGFPVVAAANPLRSVKEDADAVAGLLDSIDGPILLVGHSYGGMVISNAASGNTQVEGLVFVNALAPDAGETAMGLTAMFPGSTLASAFAAPVVLPDGSRDLTIRPDVFRAQFAADVPEPATKLMAVTQRPITQAAFGDPSGEPAWKTIPSWFVYGGLDKNIPPALHAFMADRAHSEKTVIIADGSHVVMVSHPAEVAALIVEAAGAK